MLCAPSAPVRAAEIIARVRPRMEVSFDTNVLVSGPLHPDRPIAKLVVASAAVCWFQCSMSAFSTSMRRSWSDLASRANLARDKHCYYLSESQSSGSMQGTASLSPACYPTRRTVTGNVRHFPAELGIDLVVPANLVARLDV